jgi:RNase P protein component
MRAAWYQVAPEVKTGGYDVVWVARASIRGARTQDLVPEMEELLRRARVMGP